MIKQCIVFLRNKLPKNKNKSVDLVLDAIPYTLEVGNMNGKEITRYMDGVGDIVFAEKTDR